MIKQVSIENFKSFAEHVQADLQDLLLIAGVNSSGKTTLLQAILLLAQTLETSRSDVVLDLGGKYVQFAEFREIVFGRPTATKASFTLGFKLTVDEVDLPAALREGLDPRLNVSGGQRISPALPKKYTRERLFEVKITFANSAGTPIVRSLTLEKVDGSGRLLRHTIEKYRRKYRVTVDFSLQEITQNKKVSLDSIMEDITQLGVISEKLSEDARQKFLPSRTNFAREFFGQNSLELENLSEPYASLLKNIRRLPWRGSHAWPTDVREKLAKCLEDMVSLVHQDQVQSSNILALSMDHFLPQLGRYADEPKLDNYLENLNAAFGEAIRLLRRYLQRIEYVGPLRAKPERAYLSAGTPPDIGNAGENAVPILWLEQSEKVQTKTKIGETPVEKRLVQAVKDWFEEFGIASTLHITKPKRVIYQAELESAPGSKTRVTIADVGFGVSQLLPVIVSGLRARRDTTLIFEQPEIHLHPKLQAKLADFFICLIELGKRVIVETHSEHLINMLRLRIAEDKTDRLQKRVGILFVRSSERETALGHTLESGRRGSNIEHLQVDEYGNITNWPPDFFPEQSELSEKILKAMMSRFPKESS